MSITSVIPSWSEIFIQNVVTALTTSGDVVQAETQLLSMVGMSKGRLEGLKRGVTSPLTADEAVNIYEFLQKSLLIRIEGILPTLELFGMQLIPKSEFDIHGPANR